MIAPLPVNRQPAEKAAELGRLRGVCREGQGLAPRQLQELAIAQGAGHLETEVGSGFSGLTRIEKMSESSISPS